VALGHDARPIFIQITEPLPGKFEVISKTPSTITIAQTPNIRMPAHCSIHEPARSYSSSGTFISRQVITCREPLFGEVIYFDFYGNRPALNIIVQADLAVRKKSYSAVLPPGTQWWKFPEKASGDNILKEYVEMGATHVWDGVDHLLFLVCLLLVGGGLRKIFWAVTGFTLGHSVTLALSSFGKVSFPIAVAEVLIALSIVIMVVEILRPGNSSLTHRFPIIVSLLFGLLHGFGFASALQAIGLPETNNFLGLLGFNLGVEFGQLVFITALALVILAFRNLSANVIASSNHAAQRSQVLLFNALAYVVGGLAAYWVIERSFSFWSI